MSKERIVIKHRVEAVLAEAADEVELRLAAFFDDPEDPETMHKLRVSIRTLRSLVRFVAPWQNAKQNRRADQALRDVVRETSRLRELDVLEDQVRRMEPAPAPDLVETCASAAEAERARVADLLRGDASQKLLMRARCATRCLRWRRNYAMEGLAREQVQQRFDEILDAQNARYEALDRADGGNTHDVRKRAKEVRYAAARFRKLLDDSAADAAERMKGVQDELGALCDARVNVDLLSTFHIEGLSIRARRNLAEALAANYAFIDDALLESGVEQGAADEGVEEEVEAVAGEEAVDAVGEEAVVWGAPAASVPAAKPPAASAPAADGALAGGVSADGPAHPLASPNRD